MLLESIIHKTPIEKCWSGDQKYCAVTADGAKYLLRVSSPDRLKRKQREFGHMQDVARLGIPMCLPLEFGLCSEGVYSIQSWIDGKDAEPVIVALSSAEQYCCGLDAGRLLARIHTLPAPENVPDWETR